MFPITTPLAHQEDASVFLSGNPAALLHADMGTGKSYIALSAFQQLHYHDETLTCLIVTPKSVAPNFLNEVNKHFKGVTTNLYVGSSRKKRPATITITTYDLADEIDTVDILILDEIHIIRNRSTLRFKRILKLAVTANAIWGLSGTPIVNKPSDINSIQALTTETVQYLRLIQTIPLPAVRYSSKVCGPLPSEVELISEAKAYGLSTLPLITKLRIIYSTLYTKFAYIDKLLKTHATDNFIVFSQFTQSLAALDAFLEHEKTQYLTGDTTNKKSVADRFQASAGGSLLLASYTAGGIGINLTNAHHIIFLDPAWNQATHDQAVARAHRYGLKHELTVHLLLTRSSVESWMGGLMLHKKSIMEPGQEHPVVLDEELHSSLDDALC
jgi:SNF2 family DNA or RNA helicase